MTFLSKFNTIIEACDRPFVDAGSIPEFLICQEARKYKRSWPGILLVRGDT